MSELDRPRPALAPTSPVTYLSGSTPYSSRYSCATLSTEACKARIIASVSSRRAPGSIAKLPSIVASSGEEKKRQRISPLRNCPAS